MLAIIGDVSSLCLYLYPQGTKTMKKENELLKKKLAACARVEGGEKGKKNLSKTFRTKTLRRASHRQVKKSN